MFAKLVGKGRRKTISTIVGTLRREVSGKQPKKERRAKNSDSKEKNGIPSTLWPGNVLVFRLKDPRHGE